MPLFQRDRELPILDPVAWVIAFKLHVEGIRGPLALSIALQGWAPDESFLYGPSRHVEYVWAKIPQFHRRLVGWAGAIEPPAHNKSMRTYVPISMWQGLLYFQKNMSRYSIWVFIPTGYYSVPMFQRDRELPILDPVAWVIAFKLHGEGIQGSQALSYRPTEMSTRWIFPIWSF